MVLAQSTSVSKCAAASSCSKPDPAKLATIGDKYGKLPLSFEANRGQTDERVKFLSRTKGYTLFLTGDEAVLALRGKAQNLAPEGAAGFKRASVSLKRYPDTKPSKPESPMAGVLRMKLRKANAAARVTGVDELAGRSNYFIGNDPAKWRSNVPNYAKVKYEGIYSGIDLVYYGNQRQLEYDFIVGPGADPRQIAFDVSGAKRIRREAHGELVFQIGGDEIRWHRPVVYQEKNGTRQEIAARYVTDANRVRFELAKYDASRPLYIDPLIYSTYLGGNGDDDGGGIAVDSAGSAYITGQTASINFPTTNSFQPNGGGSYDAFVVKLDPAGSSFVYSTYLGGSSVDYGYGIAVDSAGNAYVVGNTASSDFPTMNPLQAANNGGLDVFVTALSADGSALIYSTYLGGSGDDLGSGIALDSSANAYVTGSTLSTDFPTNNALQGTNGGLNDAFVAEITPDGQTLVYSTYLGGSGQDYGNGIAVDSAGNAYVTGQTLSSDFPIMNPVQSTNKGSSSAFVSKISAGGTALAYSTYLGGTGYDLSYAIAVDSAGNAYTTGSAGSTNFPTMNPLQATNHGSFDAFVTEINPTGSALVYSTYLGGKLEDDGYGIAVDGAGNVYVTGYTLSTNFPMQNAFQKKLAGAGDAFVSKITSTGSALSYSSYLGGNGDDSGAGIAVDSANYAYITGNTASTNFPTKNALQATYGGDPDDAFVTKIDVRAATTTTLTPANPPASVYGQAVTFTGTVTSAAGAPPDGETVAFMKGKTVLGTGTLSGGSAGFITSTLPVGSNTLTAMYSGDSNLVASTSKAVKQVVNKATTTTTLTSSLNPSNSGQSVTFTASVAPQYTGTVTGSVSFYDGSTLLKTTALSGGSAKYTTSKLALGSHTITVTYNGSTSFGVSSAMLTQTVN